MNEQFWKGKRVFVTGITGFKGSWLALMLLRMGAKVEGYALDPPTDPGLFSVLELEKEMALERADIRDLERLKSAIARFKPEIVIHMAAQAIVRESYNNPVDTYSSNVMGTVHVLEAARSAESVRVIINVTSDKCYENREWVWGYRENEPMGGHDPYSSSKGCAELVASAYYKSFFAGKQGPEVALVSVRAGNVIGGGDWAVDRLIPDSIRALVAGEKIVVRRPNSIRPWQLVLEPLSGYLLAAEKAWVEPSTMSSGWNFGPEDSDARPVRWIVDRVCGLWGDAGWVHDGSDQPHEAHYLKLDCSKAKTELGWTPRTRLPIALEWIVEWYRGFYDGRPPGELCNSMIEKFENARGNNE